MPFLIMPNQSQAGQQRPAGSTNSQKDGDKDGTDKKSAKPSQQSQNSLGQAAFSMGGMPSFELNSQMLQQMAGGMPVNFQMAAPQGGMMQFMMPGQQSQQGNQQGQGQQQPTMAFQFPGGMPGMGGGMPSPYGAMMGGQNPFFSMGGMPPGMMMAMPQQQQNKMNDQTKAAVSAE